MRNHGNGITINGQELRLFGKPLDSYWQIKGDKPAFNFSSNPLDCGYFAQWVLENDKLFLTEFEGELILNMGPVTFESQFPGKSLPVFADWYSGILQVQAGKLVFKSHHFGSALEYRFSLEFRKGELVGTTMHDT